MIWEGHDPLLERGRGEAVKEGSKENPVADVERQFRQYLAGVQQSLSGETGDRGGE